MAEGFARAYGADLIIAESAGLAPANAIPPLTRQVMLEKRIDLGAAPPKDISAITGRFDLIINMSGEDLPFTLAAPVENWNVRDPIGESEQVFRQVRDDIEHRVRKLIASMKTRKPAASEPRSASARVDTHGRAPRK